MMEAGWQRRAGGHSGPQAAGAASAAVERDRVGSTGEDVDTLAFLPVHEAIVKAFKAELPPYIAAVLDARAVQPLPQLQK